MPLVRPSPWEDFSEVAIDSESLSYQAKSIWEIGHLRQSILSYAEAPVLAALMTTSKTTCEEVIPVLYSTITFLDFEAFSKFSAFSPRYSKYIGSVESLNLRGAFTLAQLADHFYGMKALLDYFPSLDSILPAGEGSISIEWVKRKEGRLVEVRFELHDENAWQLTPESNAARKRDLATLCNLGDCKIGITYTIFMDWSEILDELAPGDPTPTPATPFLEVDVSLLVVMQVPYRDLARYIESRHGDLEHIGAVLFGEISPNIEDFLHLAHNAWGIEMVDLFGHAILVALRDHFQVMVRGPQHNPRRPSTIRSLLIRLPSLFGDPDVSERLERIEAEPDIPLWNNSWRLERLDLHISGASRTKESMVYFPPDFTAIAQWLLAIGGPTCNFALTIRPIIDEESEGVSPTVETLYESWNMILQREILTIIEHEKKKSPRGWMRIERAASLVAVE